MTIIKYATVAHARTSDGIVLARGKKTGQIGYKPPEDGDDLFHDPVYSEKVVELPDRMTPSEYEEYVEETVGHEEDDPVTQAIHEVAEEKGIPEVAEGWGPALGGEPE